MAPPTVLGTPVRDFLRANDDLVREVVGDETAGELAEILAGLVGRSGGSFRGRLAAALAELRAQAAQRSRTGERDFQGLRSRRLGPRGRLDRGG